MDGGEEEENEDAELHCTSAVPSSRCSVLSYPHLAPCRLQPPNPAQEHPPLPWEGRSYRQNRDVDPAAGLQASTGAGRLGVR